MVFCARFRATTHVALQLAPRRPGEAANPQTRKPANQHSDWELHKRQVKYEYTLIIFNFSLIYVKRCLSIISVLLSLFQNYHFTVSLIIILLYSFIQARKGLNAKRFKKICRIIIMIFWCLLVSPGSRGRHGLNKLALLEVILGNVVSLNISENYSSFNFSILSFFTLYHRVFSYLYI